MTFPALVYMVALLSFATVAAELQRNPFACVDKRIEPNGRVILAAVGRVGWALPREDSALEVRHQCQVMAVGTGKRGNCAFATVGVAGIAVVGIACGYLDARLCDGHVEMETAFAVCHPDAGAEVRETAEHHAVVALDLHSEEG